MNQPDLQPLPRLSTGNAPTTGPWTRMPYRDTPRFDALNLTEHWERLHVGQGLQPPTGGLAEGWALYHSGEFERAVEAALKLGREGWCLANQATAVYANYLEPREAVRLALFR